MMTEFEQTLNKVNNMQKTENGATGYSTTGKNLVDLNFTVPSNHNNVDLQDIAKFDDALKEDLVDTVKWLFYLRDVREGLGERDSFTNLFIYFYSRNPEDAIKVLPLIPVYGRWKDVIDILEVTSDTTSLSEVIYGLIGDQIKADCLGCVNGESISLLAKWLPSINASHKARQTAKRICHRLAMPFVDYRKMLSKLRNYLDVTEVKTCGDQWSEIDYNKVSSNANSRYIKAFMKHDQERREKYLQDLEHPELTGAVMHATDLYPYEVYAKYRQAALYSRRRYWDDITPLAADPAIEALWKNLKDIETVGNTMVIVDGSGSMCASIQGSSVQAIDVSRSLGVYFSERCTGEFKDKCIEFSERPQYIDLSNCETLADKFNVMQGYDDCSNTNLEKVFDMILKTAVDNHLPQDELPARLLIVSDMEFDQAGQYGGYYGTHDHNQQMAQYQTLFDTIKERWSAYGYTMPDIVFWNVNTRTKTIPVTSNECGVTLVSGFSVNNVKMILSGEINPWLALKSVLDSERYTPVEVALK